MHVDALARAGVVPIALIDPDTDRRTALGRRCPDAALAARADLVLDEFDAVIVAAPDRLHAPMSIGLLEAGKDVIVEKPMAGSRADAAAMIAAADTSGRLLAIGHIRRHLAVNPWAFEVLRSGVLGAVERVDAAHGGRDDWIASSGDYNTQSIGGVLANQGAHTVDLLNWWFGPPTVVACTDDRHGGREAEVTVELLAGRVPVHLELSRIRTKRNTVRIHTERGLLEVALDHYQPAQLVTVPDGFDHDLRRAGIEPFVEVDDDLATHFDRQLVAIADALDGRWPSTLATPREGAGVAAVLEDCDACRTSQQVWWMRSAVTGHAPSRPTSDPSNPDRAVGVLGVTGAVGGRFVEVVSGEGRAPIRALVHRWRHTARPDRFPVDLRDISIADDVLRVEALTSSLDGCAAAVSFIDGPEAVPALAESLAEGCARGGVDRLVHLGCLSSFGVAAGGRLDETVAPPRPTGAAAARRWAFEQALLAAGARFGLDVTVVTASLIYGPFTNEGAHVPLRQVDRGRVAIARTSGPCHVIYVDDVVEAVWAAVASPEPVHGRVFATGPAPISWQDFYDGFGPIVGRPATAVLSGGQLSEMTRLDPAARDQLRWPPAPGRAKRAVRGVLRRASGGRVATPVQRWLVLPDDDELVARTADVEVPLDRASALLGWAPVVGFDEGMRRTQAYLRWSDPRWAGSVERG